MRTAPENYYNFPSLLPRGVRNRLERVCVGRWVFVTRSSCVFESGVGGESSYVYVRVVHPPARLRVYILFYTGTCIHNIVLYKIGTLIYRYVGKFLCRAISLNVFSSKIVLTRYRKYII